MTVTAPPTDPAGAALDAQIATVQALVNATIVSAAVYPQYVQQLNQLQVQAINHYMQTGWLNAAAICGTYQPPFWDKAGAAIAARVAFLQNLVNNAPAMPPGNANGYGGAGWTSVDSAFMQMLYGKQTELVQHLTDVPGGTSAAAILANMTGTQTDPAGIPYEYKFNSVGFTDAWIDD